MTGGVGGFGEKADRWDEKEVTVLRQKRDALLTVRPAVSAASQHN